MAQKIDSQVRKALGHSRDAVERARRGNCRDALHWLDVAQREIVSAADAAPGNGFLDDHEVSLVQIEEASDEVLARCRRGLPSGRMRTRALKRR